MASASEFFNDLTDNFGTSLSRRIDNELNSDFLPSPSDPSNARRAETVVKTADNELGRAKYAGTGGGFVDSIPVGVWVGLGVLVVGGIAFAALK